MNAAKASAAHLRRRWNDPALVAELLRPVPQFLADGSLPHTLDLRGGEIGVQPPLADFQLFGKPYSNLDISVGRGVLGIHHCSVADLRAHGFAFDRASYFGKATVQDSVFAKFKGRFGATDSRFLGCDFSASSFRGGFNEYGFTRCVFESCRFSSARWANAYFKTCTFKDCHFEGASFQGCYVAGVKFEGDVQWEALFPDSDIRSVYLNGMKVAGEEPAG